MRVILYLDMEPNQGYVYFAGMEAPFGGNSPYEIMKGHNRYAIECELPNPLNRPDPSITGVVSKP